MDASEIASVLKLTPQITEKLKDENDYPTWHAQTEACAGALM